MEDLDEGAPLDVPQNSQYPAKGGNSNDTDSDSGSSRQDDLNTDAPDFYDPDIDDQDAEWVAKQRQGRKSDAILSCPACLTTLCIDCQQHTELECQFRAMFVMNCRCDGTHYLTLLHVLTVYCLYQIPRLCRVLVDKPVKARSAVRKKKRNRNSSLRGRSEEEDEAGLDKLCSSVVCEVCETEVGARDSEEVYHFFHVLATNA